MVRYKGGGEDANVDARFYMSETGEDNDINGVIQWFKDDSKTGYSG